MSEKNVVTSAARKKKSGGKLDVGSIAGILVAGLAEFSAGCCWRAASSATSRSSQRH